MKEEIKDVTPESSTGTEQVVNEEQHADIDQSAENQQSTQDTPDISTEPSPADIPDVNEVDEMGVPYKNRYMEYKRKFEETTAKQEEILNRLNSLGEGSQQRKYSEAELQGFIEQTDNPYHRQWALQEIEKLRENRTAELVRTELEKAQRQQQVETLKQQTLNEVMQYYPDAFQRDAQGRPMGWNNASPLTQRIAAYMQDPEISNNPRGLKVAAALAYADMSRIKQPQSQAKELKMKQELKSLQSKTLVEGGGNTTQPSVPPTRSSVDRLRQTGTVKDAKEAMKNIFKARGVIRD